MFGISKRDWIVICFKIFIAYEIVFISNELELKERKQVLCFWHFEPVGCSFTALSTPHLAECQTLTPSSHFFSTNTKLKQLIQKWKPCSECLKTHKCFPKTFPMKLFRLLAVFYFFILLCRLAFSRGTSKTTKNFMLNQHAKEPILSISYSQIFK